VRLIVAASLVAMCGCAQQMKSLQSEVPQEVPVNGVLKEVVVSGDGSRIDIRSDRPIVYTYYLQEAPPKIVVDIAQVTTGSLVFPQEVNKRNIKQIDVTRHEFGTGVLSRIGVALGEKADVSASLDSQDKKHLTILLAGAPGSQPAGAKEAEKTAPAPAQATSLPEPAPVKETVAVEEKQPVADKPVVEAKPVAPAVAPTEPAEAQAAKPAVVEPPVAAPPEEEQKPTKTEKAVGPRALKAISKSEDGITLVVSGVVDSYHSFKLTNPERLVVDLAKTRNDMSAKSLDINSFNLGKARIGSSADKLRVVFDAAGGAIPPYVVAKSEQGVQIAFSESARKSAADSAKVKSAPAVSKAETASSSPAAPALVGGTPAKHDAKPGTIDAVEFTQADGVSTITLRTGAGCTVSEPVKSAKGLYLAVKGCRLPAKLQRQLDTSGFESVIRDIVPYPVRTKGAPEARISVVLRKVVPNTVKRDGGVVRWEFREPVKPVKMSKPAKTIKPEPIAEQPAAAAAKAEGIEREFIDTKPQPQKAKNEKVEEVFAGAQQSLRPQKQYAGRKVSLEFSDADIRKIFQLLAEVSNQNFLISDDVSGTISLKLVNVPWDQALDVILENKGLGMQKDGNIVQIRPRTKMKSLDDEAIELRLTEEKKMPLSTVIFDVNFATLADIEAQFKNLKSKRPDSSISSDIRTNKIIVVDIDPNIRKMRALLEALDVPEKQVMIEARIVEASSNFVRDIGVKWDFGYQDGSASIANINNITSSMGGVVTNVLPTLTTGGVAAGMSFGKLISNIQLDLRLSAASTVGQVKIISSPKVMTVNNKPAKISQGQMIAYTNSTSTEGAKTEFIEAVLSLEVTPHITADGSVNMKIKASNNSVGTTTGVTPPINKKEAVTELVVKNGETTVIGGIFVDSETEGDTGVPFLADIPLLGWLFKSNNKNKIKNELLIFITPKIMT